MTALSPIGAELHGAGIRVPTKPQIAGLGNGQTDPAKIQAAAVEFEAVFVGQMLKPMFETLNMDPPFGGGFGERVWRDILAEKLGRSVAEAGGFGLADAVSGDLIALQEAAERGAGPDVLMDRAAEITGS